MVGKFVFGFIGDIEAFEGSMSEYVAGIWQIVDRCRGLKGTKMDRLCRGSWMMDSRDEKVLGW